jgi:hypothetical protein
VKIHAVVGGSAAGAPAAQAEARREP